jgi:hypothetical protein
MANCYAFADVSFGASGFLHLNLVLRIQAAWFDRSQLPFLNNEDKGMGLLLEWIIQND